MRLVWLCLTALSASPFFILLIVRGRVMDIDNKVLTSIIIVNSVINLMILYLVAPMYQIKGTLKQALETLGHHEHRLLSLEERING